MRQDRDIEEQPAELRRFMGAANDTSSTEIVVERGDAATEILRQAIERKVDLIVMSTHGRTGLRHVLLGSVTEKIIRNASCPVLVVPPHAADVGSRRGSLQAHCPCHRFLQGLARGADLRLALAKEADARLTLLHAIEFPQALLDIPLPRGSEVDHQHARRSRAPGACARSCRLRRGWSCTVAARVSEGKPARAILRVADEEQADLIVLGVQGRGTMDVVSSGRMRTRSFETHAARSWSCPRRAAPNRDSPSAFLTGVRLPLWSRRRQAIRRRDDCPPG